MAVLLNGTAPGASTVTFPNKQSFAVGALPRQLAVGDVNADGKLDLMVASSGSSSMSVLLNTTLSGASAATFNSQQPFAFGNSPESAALADLNDDGKPDLVAANAADNSVDSESVDQSDGTFAITVRLSTPSNEDISVPFGLSGSAMAGIDYSSVTSGPLTYMALLFRQAGPNEVAGWVSSIPQLGRQGVAVMMLKSAEFRKGLVDTYSADLLHRSSDPAGISGWTSSGLDATAHPRGLRVYGGVFQ